MVVVLNLIFGLDLWAYSAKVCWHNVQWGLSVVQKRTHVFLPEGLLTDIDHLFGKGKRSAFLTEIVEREIRKQKLLHALDEAAGSWKAEDHPELKKGSTAFVKELRGGSDLRLPKDG